MLNNTRTLLERGAYSRCIQAISKNAIENGTSWRTKKKTDARTIYICSQPKCRCMAEIRSIEIVGEILSEAFLIGKHEFHEIDNPKPLHEHLVQVVARATDSGAKSLKEAIATEVGMQIPYRNIARIRRINLPDRAWEPLWQKLPNFVKRINKNQQLAFVDEEDGLIKSVFIAFSYTENFTTSEAFIDLIFLDGAFCNDHTKSTLISAVTVTADKIIIPLGSSVTSRETIENYCNFLRHLSNFVHDSEKLTFMSDQHPAIIASIKQIYPHSKWAPCAWHLQKHLRCTRIIFYALIKSDNEELFNLRWKLFQDRYPESSHKIAALIDSIAYVKNNGVKLGYVSDSPIESFNAAIKDSRNKEPLLLLSDIIRWASHQVTKQLALLSDEKYCKSALEKVMIRKNESIELAVKEQKDGTFRVTEQYRDAVIVYTVTEKFNELRCDCNGYQRDGIPCRHEYAVANRFGHGRKLRSIAKFNETEVIREALNHDTEPPKLENIELTDTPLPEVKRRPGRPRTQRYHSKSEYIPKGTPKKCSVCGSPNHNKRRCKSVEARNEGPKIVRKIPCEEPSVKKAFNKEVQKSQRKRTTIRD